MPGPFDVISFVALKKVCLVKISPDIDVLWKRREIESFPRGRMREASMLTTLHRLAGLKIEWSQDEFGSEFMIILQNLTT